MENGLFYQKRNRCYRMTIGRNEKIKVDSVRGRKGGNTHLCCIKSGN
jgi:hypothetical protein